MGNTKKIKKLEKEITKLKRGLSHILCEEGGRHSFVNAGRVSTVEFVKCEYCGYSETKHGSYYR